MGNLINILNEYSPLLSLLFSIIAIVIAIYSSWQTSKDATRQIESIKQLSKMQLETTIKQVEIEMQKNILLARQAQEEWESIQEINNSGLAYQVEWRNEMLRQHKERKPQKDINFYNSCMKNLESIRFNLTELKKKLN